MSQVVYALGNGSSMYVLTSPAQVDVEGITRAEFGQVTGGWSIKVAISDIPQGASEGLTGGDVREAETSVPPPPVQTPEPSTGLMLGGALLMAACLLRRRVTR